MCLARDKITKIDIVKDHGGVVQEYTLAPGYSVHWTPTIDDTASKFSFVRVGGGDAPGADPASHSFADDSSVPKSSAPRTATAPATQSTGGYP